MDMGDVIESVQELHTSFGGTILRKWGFTENFARIALLHEGPAFNPNTDKEILIINLANNIARHMGYNLSEKSEEMELSNLNSFKIIDMNLPNLDKMSEDIKKRMEETASIF